MTFLFLNFYYFISSFLYLLAFIILNFCGLQSCVRYGKTNSVQEALHLSTCANIMTPNLSTDGDSSTNTIEGSKKLRSKKVIFFWGGGGGLHILKEKKNKKNGGLKLFFRGSPTFFLWGHLQSVFENLKRF